MRRPLLRPPQPQASCLVMIHTDFAPMLRCHSQLRFRRCVFRILSFFATSLSKPVFTARPPLSSLITGHSSCQRLHISRHQARPPQSNSSSTLSSKLGIIPHSLSSSAFWVTGIGSCLYHWLLDVSPSQSQSSPIVTLNCLIRI
jgi:hypothetical protein